MINQGDVGGGDYDPGQNSQTEQMEEEDVGGGSYESGQNSQTEHMEEGDEDAAEAAADDVFQEMMEEEDEDGGSAYGHDSDESDDEHVVPNPASWSHDFSSSMTVNDGHDSAWEYHQNQVSAGALYTDKQHLQDAIIKWAMSRHHLRACCHPEACICLLSCSDGYDRSKGLQVAA